MKKLTLILLLGTGLAAQASEGNFTKDPTCPGGFYLYGPGIGFTQNLWYSDDYGHSLSILVADVFMPGGLIADPVPGYLIKHQDPSIYLSTNWGLGWQMTGTAPYDITAGRSPGEIYTSDYIISNYIIKYSLNYGATWEVHDPIELIETSLMKCVGNLEGELYMLQTESGQVYRSIDFGDSFTYMSTLPVNGVGHGTKLTRGALPGELYFFNGYTGNLYFSPDSGLSFDSVNCFIPSIEYIQQMQGGTNSSEIFLTKVKGYPWGGGEIFTYFSSDYGHNFTEFHSFSTTTIVPVIMVNPLGITTFPPSGGTLNYQLEGHNNGTIPCSEDIWCDVTLPNGNPYGPIFGPILNFPLTSLWSGSRERQLFIPPNAPAGTYTLHAYVGDYSPVNPVILDQDLFQFTKTGMIGAGLDLRFVDSGESFQGGQLDGGKNHALQPEDLKVSVQPNPFNPTTVISFELRAASYVKLEVFDVSGRTIGSGQARPLREEYLAAGAHTMTFDGSNLPSGVYIYYLTIGQDQESGKMVLLK